MNITNKVFFTSIFTLELIIKIIARGFIANKLIIQLETRNEEKITKPKVSIEPYIKDSWNMVDFAIVSVAIIDAATYFLNIKG